MAKHRREAIGSRHPAIGWTYADEAARVAASGFDSYDVGGLAWQLSDNSIWLLTNTTPTWVSVGAASSITGTFVLSVRKGSSGTINHSQPCYVSGWNPSGYIEVELSDADNAAKMPAAGLASGTITNAETGTLAIYGPLENCATDSWSVGDKLYVSDTEGTLQNSKPNGGTTGIQKMGTVIRSHASAGVILISGAMRTNDIPNLSEDYIWVGDVNGHPQATALSSVSHGSLGDTGTNTHTQIDTHIATTSGNPHNVDYTDVGAAASSHSHTESDITDLDHTDSDAIHGNVSSEFTGLTEKSSLYSADLLLLEDSQDSFAKKKVSVDHVAPTLGFISGFKMIYSSATTVQVLSGVCREDSNVAFIVYAGAPLTANITSSGAGGLDTGSEASNTWYYVYVIQNPTTGTVSVLISASPTSPTMPSGYTRKRRIGSFLNSSSGNIRPFAQGGTGSERRYLYLDGYHTLVVYGTDSSWTDVDCSDDIPATSRDFLMQLKNLNNNGDIVYVRVNGQTSNDVWRVKYNDGIAETMVTDENQLIEYRVDGSASAGIFCMGYREDL